jgi:hypothetical protein
MPAMDGMLSRFLLIAFVAVLAGHLGGCGAPPSPPNGDPGDGNGDPPDPMAQVGDCLSCHTDEALLKLVAREEPPPVEESGEG